MDTSLDLVISRDIAAPRENLYRCWTEPALMKQWFAPKPWTTPHAETDPRAGGSSLVVMRGPDGQEFPNPGVYLEVVPNERIVATDAYTRAWEPSAKPFMTLILTFEDLGGGRTRYTATARHWNMADREAHEKMGFHEGWGRCTDQLAELAATLLKYLCLVYLDAAHWNSCSDQTCADYVQELISRQRLVHGEPLHPTHTATTVRVRNGEVTLFDGPFAETKEMLAGFYLVDAKDLNEAIQLAAGIPPAKYGSIEVRPVRELQVG